jgi:hypothetical protein
VRAGHRRPGVGQRRWRWRRSTAAGRAGGFGGGGSGAYDIGLDAFAAGGGGGFNGGGGGGIAPGGGGGSFSASPTLFSASGAQAGNGLVSFCFTPNAAATIPTVSELGLLALALLLAGLALRRLAAV